VGAVSEFERARKAFRRRWGFDPSPFITDALRAGDFDLVGGDEDTRAFIRETLTATGDHPPRTALYPAGDCVHCGLPIEESHLFEFRPRDLFATDRPLTILIHTGSGRERCDARDTVAERSEPEEQQ
jgi:hypothetical protein